MILGAEVKVTRRLRQRVTTDYGIIVDFFDGIYPVVRFSNGSEETFEPHDLEFIR